MLLEFYCFAPGIDETPSADESPFSLVKRLAKEKAESAVGYYRDHLIISSDQTCFCEDKLYGKPGNHERAKAQLLHFQGKNVTFLTSLCVLNSRTKMHSLDVVETNVQFRNLSEHMLQRYLVAEKPYECAGGFKAEGAGIMLFNKIIGNDPTALVGLPLITLTSRLMDQGFSLLGRFGD